MSAAIIQFPAGASHDAIAALPSPIAPAGLATKFADHFLPVVQASVDLHSADEADFEARCRRMLDNAGTAMIDELCAEMQIVGRQMRLLADGLDLTRARLCFGATENANNPRAAGYANTCFVISPLALI